MIDGEQKNQDNYFPKALSRSNSKPITGFSKFHALRTSGVNSPIRRLVMQITPYQLAERFIGTQEITGQLDNPQVMAMLKLDMDWPEHDEVPWCSAFINYITWMLRLPRSKSLLARSWLEIGEYITIHEAKCDSDIVILNRETPFVGANNLTAKGHVGFYAGLTGYSVYILGGNQSNKISVAKYDATDILGVRRLWHG